MAGGSKGGTVGSVSSRRRRLTVATVGASILTSSVVVTAVETGVVHAAVITVNSTGDEQITNGQCTLREAIYNANADNAGLPDCAAGSGTDTIVFNLGAPGVYTINTSTGFPGITGQLTIAGETQSSGSPDQLSVQISGNGGNLILFDLSGSVNSTISGLIINGAGPNGNAIIPGIGTVIQHNWIGTDSTGLAAAAIANGVGIYALQSSNVTIGSVGAPQVADRNVISGNGIGVLAAGNGSIHSMLTNVNGNYIGTDRLGTGLIGNGFGVRLDQGSISTSIRNNVISGNTTAGVQLAGPEVTDTIIQGNVIGLSQPQTSAMPNGYGIRITGAEVTYTTIGGVSAGLGNVISGNTNDGIRVEGDAILNTIQGNWIGTAGDGVTARSNGGDGIAIYEYTASTTIGGINAGEGNTIAYNARGISATSGSQPEGVISNSIRGNRIFNNTGLGIALDGGVANDPGDADDGANYRQNFPSSMQMTIDAGGILRASYTVDSLIGESGFPIDIDFYEADSQLSGEGQRFLNSHPVAGPGTTIGDPLGNAAVLGIADGDYVVATATDNGGNTSQFSAPVQVVSAGTSFVVNNVTDGADSAPGNGICETSSGNGICTLRAAIEETNATGAADSIIFNIGAPGHAIIQPSSALPTITAPTIIDASTEPGTNCGVWPPVLKVEIDARNIDSPAAALAAIAPVTIRGLAINRYSNDALFLDADDNVVQCNFIGTDITGNIALGTDGVSGIFLNGSDNNLLGGASPGQGNVIAGVAIAEWLRMAGSNDNVVQGNHIGVGADGSDIGGFPNRGILLTGSNNTIGGIAPGEGNVIANAGGMGIDVASPVTGNTIRGNRIERNAGLGIDLFDPNDPAFTLPPEERPPYVGVTFNHLPPPAAQPVGAPNNFQNFPVITAATGRSEPDLTFVKGTLVSAPGAYQIDVYNNDVCHSSSFGEGQRWIGSISVTTDANGYAEFEQEFLANSAELSGITATATSVATGDTSEFSYCRPVATTNLTWYAAQELGNGEPTQQYISDNGQEKWFKIQVNPGDKVNVQLTGGIGSAVSLHRDPLPYYNSLTNPSSAAVLSAEAADIAFLPSGSLPSGSLPSGSLPSGSLPSGSLPSGSLERGFLPSGSLPSGSLPSGSLPSGSLPSGSLPSGSLPSGSLPSGSLPSGSLPSGSLPSGSLPSGSLPSGSLPSGSLPSGSLPSGSLDAYSSASRRSLMGISMDPYSTTQTIDRQTFDLQEYVYVRVVGPLDTSNKFTVQVSLTGGVCSNLVAIPTATQVTTLPLPTNLGLSTVIVTDSTRLPGTSAERSTAMADLDRLRTRADVNGTVVDLASGYPRVAAARQQANANPACPAAQNTLAKEIKAVIDLYRAANQASGATTLQYVVLAGGADVIPFFQVQDIAGLANEKEYVPPVEPNSPSEAGLRSGLVKGQDFYGSSVDLTIGSRTLAVPGLAVGRLVERATDISAAVNAYIATNGVVAPSTSLVTGYDFVGDAAQDVRDQFTAATLDTDTLIQPPGQGADGLDTWSADDVQTKLAARNNGVVMLSGHFSAGSLLAADYRTSLTAAEVGQAASFSNSVVLALGCHGGFTLPSSDLLAGASPDPDWAKMFLRDGAAAYIAATGYAYGDTELTEYGERLFVNVAKQMRTGSGPVPMGRALVDAKRDYLANTAQIAGIDEKTIVEMTLYGLPMMRVNMPGPRLNAPVDTPIVGGTTSVTSGPGVTAGLSTATVGIDPTLTRNDVPLTNLDTTASVNTTYFSGADGVVANPFEPIQPKQIDNVTAGGKVLRGVALRGGTYQDVAGVIPLTTAPATETSRPHQSYVSDVFYPSQLFVPNFYDAVDGGATRLVTVPAQYRSSSPGSISGTIRTYTELDLALYYMPSNWPTATGTAAAAAKAAAVSAGPSITGASATVTGSVVTFTVNASSDGSAGIQQVWVLYTADPGSPFYGRWAPVDLVQDAVDATVWTGSLELGATPASAVHFMVQAVNGAGLATLASNLGAFYSVAPSTPPPAPLDTSLSLSVSSSGSYLQPQTLTATLTDEFSRYVEGQTLTFDLAGQSALAVTDDFGTAQVTITPVATPGPYTARVTSKPSTGFNLSTTSRPFTVNKAATTLDVAPASTTAVSGDASGITARLQRSSTRVLDGKTVTFLVTDGATSVVKTVTTDNTGIAPLPALDLAPGTYSVTAFFAQGSPGGVALPADDNYLGSQSGTVTLTVTPAAALAITVATRNADGSAYIPGTWTRQNVTVDFTCTPGQFPIQSCTLDRTITAEGTTAASIGTATDTAGNTATVNVGAIQIDKTAPTITVTTPAANASFTVGAVVNAAFTCVEPPDSSGVFSCSGTKPAGQAIDTATPGTKTFTVDATDNAGNQSTTSVTYTVTPAAPPAITVATRNADGSAYIPGTWTRQNVTVDFTCTPGPFPIQSCTPDRTVTTEGTAAASIGTATDTAGNTATVNVGAIQIDKTAPTITVTTPAANASFTVGAVVNAAYTCADQTGRAGIATCTGTVPSGQAIDTATPGTKTFTANATDNAGNSVAKSVTYTVVAANQAPVVRADMGITGLQEIGFQSNTVILTGSFSDADGSGPYKASLRWAPTSAYTPFVLNSNSQLIAAFVYPSAGTRVVTVRVCDSKGACGTDDVTVRTSVTQKVTPVLECVTDRGNRVNPRYSARFGYNNPAPFAIYIPTTSSENTFTSSPALRGQPQIFLAGNQRNVFTTTFNSGSISWKLNGTTVTAKTNSPRC